MIHPHLNAIGPAKISHEFNRESEQFSFGQKRVTAQDVHIELPVLAQTPLLRPLITPEIRNAKKPDGPRKLMNPRRHQTRHCGRHFGTNSNLAISPIDKMIELLVDEFFARLCGIEVKTLNHGTAVLKIAKRARHLGELSEHPVSELHVFGVKIACALVGFGRNRHDFNGYQRRTRLPRTVLV